MITIKICASETMSSYVLIYKLIDPCLQTHHPQWACCPPSTSGMHMRMGISNRLTAEFKTPGTPGGCARVAGRQERVGHWMGDREYKTPLSMGAGSSSAKVRQNPHCVCLGSLSAKWVSGVTECKSGQDPPLCILLPRKRNYFVISCGALIIGIHLCHLLPSSLLKHPHYLEHHFKAVIILPKA